jgi:PAS domain S-box-containing protein
MNIYSVVIGCSILLQTISAVLAVRLLIRPGRRITGLVILTAISLMAFRRVISLWRALTENAARTDLPAELVALIISVLFLIGILYITRLIKAQEKTAGTLQDSTEALLTSEALYRNIVETTAAVAWEVDIATLRFNYISPQIVKICGFPAELWTDFNFWLERVHPDDREYAASYCQAETAKGLDHAFEYRMITADNRIIWIRDVVSVIKEQGKVVSLRGYLFDITERKRAETALRESEERFRSIYDNIGIGIALIGKDMEILAINPRMQRWFPHIDLSRRHICYRSFNIPPRDAICYYCPTIQTLKDGQVHMAVTNTPTESGIRHYQVVATPLRAADGSIAAAIEMVEDVTERKQVEEALQVSEERYRLLTETSPNAITVANISGQISMVNHRALSVYGHSDSAEVLGRNIMEWIPPKEQEKASTAFAQVCGGGNVTDFELRLMKADGELFWGSVNASLAREHDGRPPFVIIVTTDVTGRKIAEEKVRQNEEFIRNILDAVDEGFIVVARDHRIMTANKAYCRQVCLPLDEVIGKHCYKVSHETDRPCYEDGEECAVQHVFETGEPHTALHRHADAERGILYIETKAYPLRDVSGNVTAVIETINNITEKHLLEKERLKTQKLESIGLLAGGIAHDFNNLLQGVFGYISMVKVHLNQKEKALEMIQQAEMALHMSVNLTSQLLTFSKGGMPVKKKLALCPLIENSVKFALSGSRIDYTLTCEQALWMVEADEGQLGQVIQNIVLNADQAMPMGGVIQVSVKMVRMPAKGLSARLPEGNYVEVTVTDNGIGIPEQYLSRIFDPYFTTKDKGSGLGLATSYSIIKNHGGLIDVKSKPGEGTTFSVYLPAIELEEEQAETVPETKAVVRKGRILLMDDEELLRSIVGVMMTSLGHEVELTENGDEAVAKYREALQAGRRFDAVILDLTIRGGKGGEATLRELLALDPAVKAVVSSGYSDSSAIAEYESRGFRACLTKPYTVDALRDMLNVLLA